jgi:hypothetical protein
METDDPNASQSPEEDFLSDKVYLNNLTFLE